MKKRTISILAIILTASLLSGINLKFETISVIASGDEGAEQRDKAIEDLSGYTPSPRDPLTENPKLTSKLDYLVQAERREGAELYAEQHDIELVDGSVRVYVECEPDMIEEATEAARALGIVELEAIVSEDIVYPYLEVLIPIVKLNALAREKSIIRVELPGRVYPQGQ
jgi:hypothetical protein